MIQSIFHTSEKGNVYLYDNQRRFSMLAHPKLKNIHESLVDDSYYSKKYLYLKKFGFFSEYKLNNIEVSIDDSMIEYSIKQTKQILFEVTTSCNLNCSYCIQGELYHDPNSIIRNKKISISSAVKLLKYIFKFKAKEDKLSIGFYGGEPLLNINFIKRIVEIIHQLDTDNEMNIDYLMTTNATLIHKHIDFLVDNKFNIMISLDGNEGNDSYRIIKKNNKKSFSKVIKNIDFIKDKYPDYFKNNISFNAVLHNRNSVKDIYEFIYNRYAKKPRIAELKTNDINPHKKDIIKQMFNGKRKSETEYRNDKSNLLPHDELLSYNDLTGFLKYLSINYYISNVYSLFYNEEKFLPTNTCLPFSKKIFLTSSNKLLPCEKISDKYFLGEVNKNIEIDIPSIRRKYNSYYKHLKKHCQHCYLYRYCGLCMFDIKDLQNLDTEEFVCNYFHDQNAFQSRLHHIFSFLEKYPSDFFHILEDTVILL